MEEEEELKRNTVDFETDWFGRKKKDGFTSYDKNKRLFDWDKDRENYSSFFLSKKDTGKEAADIVSSMFNVIGVPKTYKYHKSNNDLLNDGSLKAVNIPLHMLRKGDGADDYTKDLNEIDAFYGACIQNAALATMQTNSEYKRTLLAQSDKNKKGNAVRDLLYASLNTERIDGKLSDRFPGYLKFVQKYKDYKFNKNYKPLADDEDPRKRLLDLTTRMIRYPGNVTQEELDEFAAPLREIERAIKKYGGLPQSGDDCDMLAEQLTTIIKEYQTEEEEESEKDKDSGGKGDEELEDFASSMQSGLVNEESEGSGKISDSAMSDFEEESKEGSNKINTSYTGEIGKDAKVKFKKASEDKYSYIDVRDRLDLTKAKVLNTLLARKSKDNQFVLKAMKSGRFDTNKIAEAVQHVPTVYERIGTVKTNKLCIGILIDESGSMGGTKIKKAQEAAIFLNETFKNSRDTELFIYGHTADHSGGYGITDIDIYREPGAANQMFALGSVKAKSNNRDGTAIYATAARIRTLTKRPGILFVISDGQPSAHDYGGSSAIEDTRKKVLKAESLGFQVIQIAIEGCVPSEQMFKHFVKMTDIKSLPRDLVMYVSKKVDALIKETVTM